MAIRDPVKAADDQDASSSSALSPKSSLVSQVLELFPRALRTPQISRVLKRLSDAAGFISTHGLRALRGRKIPTADYHAWIAKHEARTEQWYRAIRAEVAAFQYQPRIIPLSDILKRR